MRIWIEGETAAQPGAPSHPIVRRADLTVPADWSSIAVRAAEIPPGGLIAARLRFELLGAGRLWIDDLALNPTSTPAPAPAADPILSETERLNARRALVAALIAYRDNRYADFARLAASHWARLPAVGHPAPRAAGAGTDPAVAPPGEPE